MSEIVFIFERNRTAVKRRFVLFVRDVAGDGRFGRGHVHLLQDVDASGSDRCQEAHGEGSADRRDHATR